MEANKFNIIIGWLWLVFGVTFVLISDPIKVDKYLLFGLTGVIIGNVYFANV